MSKSKDKKSTTRTSFKKANEFPYEVTVVIGDWSDDGHGKSRNVSFRTSHSVDALKGGYLKSVQETGLTFDHDHEGIQICTECEDHALTPEVQKKLQDLGFDMKKISDPEYVSPEEFAGLILWFSGRGLSDFQYRPQRKGAEYLNGYWDKKLNVQFGYGLFDPS